MAHRRDSASSRANQRDAVAFTRAQRTSSGLAIGIPGAAAVAGVAGAREGVSTTRAPARRRNTSPYSDEWVRWQNGHW